MAHDAHADHGHGHGHGGRDHVPHVSPLSLYLKTFGALMVLTVVTVTVSQIDLGTSTNLAIAMIIATIKASVVAALFMHLSTDRRFHIAIFLSSLVFLTIFITFTSFDTTSRGRAESIERDRPFDSTKPWDPKPAVTAQPTATPQGAPAPH